MQANNVQILQSWWFYCWWLALLQL